MPRLALLGAGVTGGVVGVVGAAGEVVGGFTGVVGEPGAGVVGEPGAGVVGEAGAGVVGCVGVVDAGGLLVPPPEAGFEASPPLPEPPHALSSNVSNKAEAAVDIELRNIDRPVPLLQRSCGP
jgi:hypothetical protein